MDNLSDNYKEHYKDRKLLSLIEYAVDNRHEDNDVRISQQLLT